MSTSHQADSTPCVLDPSDCQWCKGYADQSAWLEGKSLAAAEQALDTRLATLGDSQYNDGGDTATRDYIRRRSGVGKGQWTW